MSEKARINIFLIQVVEGLNTRKQNALLNWLQLSSSNHMRQTHQIVSFIIKNNYERAITFSDIHQVLFGNKPIQENKIRAIVSNSLKLVESFLMANYMEQKPMQFKMNLLDLYGEMELERGLNLQENQLRKLHSQNNKRTSEDLFLNKYQLGKLVYHNNIYTQRNIQQEVINLIGDYEQFNVLEQLRIALYAVSNKVADYMNKMPFFSQTLDALEHGKFEAVKIIQAYYRGYICYIDRDNVENYFRLKSILKNDSELFSVEDLRTLILTILNFSIVKHNTGDSKFTEEMFSTYQLGLENKSLLNKKGFISRWTFQNIVSTALFLNETSWVEAFLAEYKNKIGSSDYLTVFQYNLSKLFYKKKEFKAAILHLQKIDSKDVVEVLNAKALLLRIYFEEEEWEALDALLSSFEQYIRRQKKLGYQKKGFLNLIRFTNRLSKLTLGNRKQLEVFKQRVKTTEALADKSWLLSRVDSMLAKKNS